MLMISTDLKLIAVAMRMFTIPEKLLRFKIVQWKRVI